MSNKVFGWVLVFGMLFSCSGTKLLSDQEDSEAASMNGQKIGHLKMGLIDYEVLDTTMANEETAEFMIDMMRPSFETELVFNEQRSADLIKKSDGTGYSRTSLYDRHTKTSYEFLNKDSIHYYAIIDIPAPMAELSEEEDERLRDMIRFRPYSEAGIEVFGFPCDEITMMNPSDLTVVQSMVLTTDRIPHISESIAPLNRYLSGAPLKTEMYVNGLKITIGAIAYSEDSGMGALLELDTTGLTRISYEALQTLKRG